MVSVIIFETENSSESIQGNVDLLNQIGQEDYFVIGKNLYPEVRCFDTTLSSLTECTLASLALASSESILLLDGSLLLTEQQLREVVVACDGNMEVKTFYAPVQSDDSIHTLSNLDTSSLVNLLTIETSFPASCVGINKSLLQNNGDWGGETIQEILLHSILLSIIEGYELVELQAIEPTSCSFDHREISRALGLVVNSCNIEELFPNHAWADYQEESAAACYHTLAAHFIRYNDMESALSCLKVSDHLEDSPRSLALKGLISIQKGEVLGAVANLVSSLQQYETRKKNENGKHYLYFDPSDFEFINDNLTSGLTALNQQDNNTALKHFAEAVFNFDSFYKEHGVNLLLS